jgi:hypothetical protein
MTFEEQLSQDEKVRHLLRAGDFEKKSYGWRWFPLSGCGRPSLGKVRDVLKAFRDAGFKVSAKQKCGTYRMEHSKQITSEQIQESMEKVQVVNKVISITPSGGFKKGMMAVFKCAPAFSVREIK